MKKYTIFFEFTTKREQTRMYRCQSFVNQNHPTDCFVFDYKDNGNPSLDESDLQDMLEFLDNNSEKWKADKRKYNTAIRCKNYLYKLLYS